MTPRSAAKQAREIALVSIMFLPTRELGESQLISMVAETFRLGLIQRYTMVLQTLCVHLEILAIDCGAHGQAAQRSFGENLGGILGHQTQQTQLKRLLLHGKINACIPGR